MFKFKITALTQKGKEILEWCFSLVMKIPHDKMGHIIIGAEISTFVSSACLIFGVSFLASNLIAVSVTTVLATLKEIYDRLNKTKHTSDIYDALATILGSLPIILIALAAASQ